MLVEKLFTRLDQIEGPVCRRLASLHSLPIGQLFKLVSWLGNGPAWGVLIACFLFYQPKLGAVLLAATVVNMVVYRALKRATVRRRPFQAGGFEQGARALDEFSFPSGHTLHAWTLTLMCYVAKPWVGLALLPVAGLIALSRVVLGLHYPSDVLAALGLGTLVAYTALLLL